MENKQNDIFELSKANGNFFLNDAINEVPVFPLKHDQNTKHLNDYDLNLIQEGAYKNIKNDKLKIEYKITKIEKLIENLDIQMASAKEINDTCLLNDLQTQKNALIKDYNNLTALYNKSIPIKFTENITKIWEHKFTGNNSDNILSKLWNKLYSQMPQKILSILKLKQSLTKLKNINKSVDSLVTLNIPYGENAEKYTQLSKYIIKANSIQADIKKNLK